MLIIGKIGPPYMFDSVIPVKPVPDKFRKRESRRYEEKAWIPVPAFAGPSLPLRKQGQE